MLREKLPHFAFQILWLVILMRGRNLTTKPTVLCACIFCEQSFLRRWAITFMQKKICPECAGKLFERMCLDQTSDLEDEVFEDE